MRSADFFDLKADLEAILGLTGDLASFCFLPAGHPALHPGQAARIERSGRGVGVMGMLHPGLAAELDIIGNAFLFQLEVEALGEGALPSFVSLSKFPTIRRDLAIVVNDEIPYQQVRECVTAAASDFLRDLVLFDVYQGDKIDSGTKSLALGLILQASSQTLTEQQVELTISRVLQRLETELGARLRD
jgi:phenylalanyl-tRNA synthetase beta chain